MSSTKLAGAPGTLRQSIRHSPPSLNTEGILSQTEGDQLKIRTIRDFQGIAELRDLWRKWQKTRDSDFDFFCEHARARGAGCRPHVLLLTKHAEPQALLLGLRDRRRIGAKFCSVAFYQPEVNVLDFIYGGLLGNPSRENCAALAQAIIRSLSDGDADIALWEALDLHSALYSCLLHAPNRLSRDHRNFISDHWFMTFPASAEAFLANRSKLRRKVNRIRSTLAERIQVRSFQTASELERAIPLMEEIGRRSVKRQLGFGFFDTPRTREELLLKAARGWVRSFILYVDEKPASFWLGSLDGRCLRTEYVGFDDAWRALSPGILVFLHMLDSLREENIATIDLGWGDGHFYRRFGDLRRSEASVQVYAPRLRALRLNLIYTLAHYATLTMREIPFVTWARRVIWHKMQRHAFLARSEDREPWQVKSEPGNNGQTPARPPV